VTEEEQGRLENIANEIDDILFAQFKGAWERIQFDIDSLPLADIKFLTSIPGWQVEIEELVGIPGPIAFIGECIELSLSRPNRADPYAAAGWQYGIPEQNGWYWMLGYEEDLEDERSVIYEIPTMVYRNQYSIFIKTNGSYGYSYRPNDKLTAMFLPILPPEVV
jgi:hypothetical protein